jgi:hypothetical protein
MTDARGQYNAACGSLGCPLVDPRQQVYGRVARLDD